MCLDAYIYWFINVLSNTRQTSAFAYVWTHFRFWMVPCAFSLINIAPPLCLLFIAGHVLCSQWEHFDLAPPMGYFLLRPWEIFFDNPLYPTAITSNGIVWEKVDIFVMLLCLTQNFPELWKNTAFLRALASKNSVFSITRENSESNKAEVTFIVFLLQTKKPMKKRLNGFTRDDLSTSSRGVDRVARNL